MSKLILSPASRVRAAIGAALLEHEVPVGERLAGITLRPHQRTAAARLIGLIREHGGAMLADPVGMGKTYTALAVAVTFGDPIVIVAPASLRQMWRDALRETGVSASVVTHEALSRGSPAAAGSRCFAERNTRDEIAGPGDRVSPRNVVIVDEAHRARTPSTRRYARLASLCQRARVLLVTATPLQNRRAELAAQLALFIGRRAWEFSDDELAAHVVRGGPEEAHHHTTPRQIGPIALELPPDDDCLDQILTLPPPLAAADEGLAGALLVYGLVHQWASSRAALAASIRRRRARGLALAAALDSGRLPTRIELAAWTQTGDAMQLAFPEIVAPRRVEPPGDARVSSMPPALEPSAREAMAIAVDRHLAALSALRTRLRSTTDPDDARAELLRRVRRSHPEERVIAFCQYAETVEALWSRLSGEPGVAALTARGARVAGGRITRNDVIAQLSPRASTAVPIRSAERITLLITTDLLSEGLNLQEASVVVHLDLPWNPARLDQRVGRVRRMGSRHEVVTIYCVAPPAAASRLLRIEERLRDKLRAAERTIGVAGQILPSPVRADATHLGLAERSTVVDRALRAWAAAGSASCSPAVSGEQTLIAAVRSDTAGYLALIRESSATRLPRDTRLIAALSNPSRTGGLARDVERDLERAVALATGPDISVGEPRIEAVLRAIRARRQASRASDSIDLGLAASARSRRAALGRVAATMARAPRHRRAQLAPLADVARAVATAPLGVGAERILATLVAAELPDEAWLKSIATFGELNCLSQVRSAPNQLGVGEMIDPRSPGTEAAIVAVLILEPDGL